MLISAEYAVKILNELWRLDPKAMEALVRFKVPCNQKWADHKTVQVGVFEADILAGDNGERFEVGPLGLINGIFGIREDGLGHICGLMKDGKLAGFGLTKDYVEAINGEKS